MQKENLIVLTLKQKLHAAAVIAAAFVIVIALFILNGGIKAGQYFNSAAVFFLVILLGAGVYFYIEAFSKKSIQRIRHTLLIAVALLISFQLCALFNGEFLSYARPLYAFAMIITILCGKQEGLVLNAYFTALLYLFDVYYSGFDFIAPYAVYSGISCLLSGTVAVIFTVQNNRRLDTVLSAFKLGFLSMLAGVAVFAAIKGPTVDIFLIGISAFLSALFSLLIYLGLLPLLERIFNIITFYRLSELTDHNRSLLKKLAQYAPGTFNHSIAVANLAEACAIAIGESPQLARAAAYYHDIGKIKYPQFFKENQGKENPHDDLTPELSASFIKKHAVEGYNLCREHRLPEEIASICLEHHGTTVIKYFYYQATKYTEGDLSTNQFRYPGPKPKSRIAAIIMIADAAEAAIRVLPDRNKEVIEQQVREIIDERMDLDQFSDCDITMHDIYTIINQIVNISLGIYHDRTDYPKLKFTSRKRQYDTNYKAK